MKLSLLSNFVLIFVSPFTAYVVNAQTSTSDGYTGYSLTVEGDQDSTVYDTASTPANVSTTIPEPDVFLNASVSVGEIDITVSNLTAKINLDVQVLQLLTFNAGVAVSIDSVELLIQNVSAHVLLEARLENVLKMINDTLDSIDLNPIIATLGQDVSEVVNSTVGAVTGSSSTVAARSFDIINNILYSINDYSGNTHTNRILAQNGDIVDQFLNNDGTILGQRVVGSYLRDMTFNGYNQTVTKNGQVDREIEYVYNPYYGLSVVSAIYVNAQGKVLATQVLSESSAGGSSTISDL